MFMLIGQPFLVENINYVLKNKHILDKIATAVVATYQQNKCYNIIIRERTMIPAPAYTAAE